MNRQGSHKHGAKLYSAWMLLFLLTINSGPVLTVSAEDPPPTGLSTSADLDEDVSKWGIYEERGDPISDISNATSPSLDGRSLRCAILGGDPYSNVHCYRNLLPDITSDVFSLSLSFQYQPASSFNNAGVPSIVQGLEFTMSKWENGVRYEWALQWDNVDVGAPKWRYWDPARPEPDRWVDVGVSGGVTGMQWHTLKVEGELSNGQVHYRRFTLDNVTFPLDKVVAPALEPAEPDKLAVAVQLDGNSAESPYELFIDEVTLVTAQTFADTALNYWAFDWIKRLYNANITGGCGLNPLRYCPEASVTRAQMAIFLLRGIHGSSYNPPAVGASTGFGDVSTTYWAAGWIKQLATEGITGGCGSGNYCPEGAVTRAQIAVFLLRSKYGASYNPLAVGGGTGFSDVPIDYWAGAWIKQLVAEGITAGCGAGNYCPEAPVTRAQMAVFLVRTFNLP